MSAIFKNSFYSIVSLVLVFGIGLRFYLSNSTIVPPWIPPPLCPCWDSNNYRCQTSGFCNGDTILQPTPTPYLQAVVTKPKSISIQSLVITPDCKINITLSTSQTDSFNLPSDKTIQTANCLPIKTFTSDSGQYAVFDNLSNPQKPSATLYSLKLNKVVALETWTNPQTRIIFALFLPDNHLVLLFYNQIKTYDLNTLFNNYPGNIDFYQNKFKSISLESTTINLNGLKEPPSYLSLSGNSLQILRSDNVVMETLDLVKIYPRSSCPCWDTQNNYCLPQSSCLAP